MPCRDGREHWSEAHTAEGIELLCKLLKTFAPTDPEWTPELRRWWAEHQDHDLLYARMIREGK